MVKYLTPVLLICFASFLKAHLTLQEIRTAADDVIVLYFTSDTLNVQEVDTQDALEWKINGNVVKGISRFATKADACDHYIYLQTDKLIEGKSYRIETPYGNTEFKFNERKIFCESIKTNQAAYSARKHK